jgi:hypothetical protein
VGEWVWNSDALMLTDEQRLIRRKESLSQCHIVCRKSQMDWPAIGSVPPTSDAQIVISLSDVGAFSFLSQLYHITVFVTVGDAEIY